MLLPKKTNEVPITEPKEIEIYELSSKELRIIPLISLENHKKTQTYD